MRKPTSAANATPIRVVIVTLDKHVAGAVDRAAERLREDLPGLTLTLHASSTWGDDPDAIEAAKADVLAADIVVCTMMFIDEHVKAILPALEARRDDCDAMVALMSAGEVMKMTRMGKFAMDGEAKGVMGLLKRLRGSKKPGASSGANQMKVLRRLPKILKFIPGTAQDVRAYFMAMQYWLASSDQNLEAMVRFLVERYASGPRASLREVVTASQPIEYPETGLYHPRLPERITDDVSRLPSPPNPKGTVGLLIMRSYVLAGDTGHYDGVIEALESRGLRVIPAFAAGLDARPAVDAFFGGKDGEPVAIDAILSLTGFSLVGGPAYNDAKAAEDMLARLDVPYVAAHALEFQTIEQWRRSEGGLSPVEATIMVAIPELDGATSPLVYGGRAAGADGICGGCDRCCALPPGRRAQDMMACAERVDQMTGRVERLVRLKRSERAKRKLGIVLFNFPPNAGATGTAAFLGVFESLHNTMLELARAGYAIEVPESVDALRERILGGNSATFGTDANVVARIPAGDHVKRERWLADIEGQWGAAPGTQLSDGATIFVQGERFGNVFVGVQPGFGYEGDPMRLLFEKGFTPTHAFSAFYRWLREDFEADVLLHFGTHGALEFMPGKQTGLASDCWPDRLIGEMPNVYLYAANNPSEGTIAKRRASATLVSYLTPPLGQAGLYKGLTDLKASVDRWRSAAEDGADRDPALAELIQAQAAELDLVAAEPFWGDDAAAEIDALQARLLELEQELIPHGLHVVGTPAPAHERADMLMSVAEAAGGSVTRAVAEALAKGASAKEALALDGGEATEERAALFDKLALTAHHLATDSELSSLIHALDGGFVRPAAAGDLLKSTDILPTGRNLHGFDPFRMPTAYALSDGARQAERLLERHVADGHPFPETIALVLWGTDNLKTEGGPIAQALALMGAKPRFDAYGRLAGAELVDLETLGRPRIDVMVTLSGIFRDLLPLQTKLIAEAAYLAAAAEEPEERNFVRKHALAYQAAEGCDLETAALRVFSNADGAYGANVNQLVDSGAWDDENELADAYTKRKSFAYGRSGKPVQQTKLLESVLSNVELAYQNLESVELGVTTIDHYFDTLGGIGRAVRRAKGESAQVYIGDQTRSEGKVRTLSEQVALETRTRTLNPRWYEGMLKHGYEGVRQIEAQITNTLGWSATTGEVDPWVYQRLTQTFVLDTELRDRMAALNPAASARLANRLIEAHERRYWEPDPETLAALQDASEELEDRLEGVHVEAAA